MMSAPPPDPTWSTAIATAKADLASGRPDLALSRLQRVLDDPEAPSEAVRLCAIALRGLNLTAAARPLLERVVRANPTSAVAEHNLAAALGDLGDVLEAEKAARRALDKGGAAPETWLVLGRALQGLGRTAEAEAAYRQSLRIRPAQIDARRDLAQLIWMRTGDRTAAMAPFDTTNTPIELHVPLIALGAAAMLDMESDRAAYDWLVPFLSRQDAPGLNLIAAKTAGEFDPQLALRHAQAASEAAPEGGGVRIALATALMACGRTAEALPMLEVYLHQSPDDQYAIGLRYSAWRILADPRALGPVTMRR